MFPPHSLVGAPAEFPAKSRYLAGDSRVTLWLHLLSEGAGMGVRGPAGEVNVVLRSSMRKPRVPSNGRGHKGFPVPSLLSSQVQIWFPRVCGELSLHTDKESHSVRGKKSDLNSTGGDVSPPRPIPTLRPSQLYL